MNPDLARWQLTYGVSNAAMLALHDILTGFTAFKGSAERPKPRSEAAVQERERLSTARNPNLILWRNQVGAAETVDGRQLRFGLANDSQQMNKIVKSADLIGIWRYRVQPQDVGRDLGVFVSDELKAEDWTARASDTRYQAQLTWATLVASYGGVSIIHNGMPGTTLLDKLNSWTF